MFHFILADLRRNRIGVALVALLVALATALGVAVTLQERALRLGSARASAPFDLVVGAAGSETQLVLSAVFLQAAPLPLAGPEVLAALRADPRVEDSPFGVQGAVAAGMAVIGFTGGGHTTPTHAETLRRAGAGRIFSHWDEIAEDLIPAA